MFGLHDHHGHGCGPRGRWARMAEFAGDEDGRGERGGRFGRGPGGRGFGGRGFGGPGFGGPWGGRGRMFEAGALRIAVLQLIAERPRHGYDVIKALEERLNGLYSPSPGAIYPLLQMFEEADYVTAAQDGAKKLYTITEGGRAFLEENRETAARLDAQMAQASAGLRRADLMEALHAFRSTLMGRLRGGDLTPAQVDEVRRILDEARGRIEGL